MGMLGLNRWRRLLFAASCAFFEMVMPLIGLYLGLELRSRLGPVTEWLSPFCLVLCGLLVLIAVAARKNIPWLLDRPQTMVLVPLALSFDNLAAGAHLSATAGTMFFHAAVVGTLSGGMCLLGFAAGERVRLRAPHSARIVAATWFFACAALFVFADLS
jgi:putative Mn2+ efflux pump MntP